MEFRRRQTQGRRLFRRSSFQPRGSRGFFLFAVCLIRFRVFDLTAGKTQQRRIAALPERRAAGFNALPHARKTVMGERVPGFDADIFFLRVLAVSLFNAANIKPVPGARRRYIKEAPIFLKGELRFFRTRLFAQCYVIAFRPGEQRRRAGALKHRADIFRIGRAMRVEQEHHIGFEPLGAVYRHHAHGVVFPLHLALDLAGSLVEPGDEFAKAARIAVFEIKRLTQELIHGVGGGFTKPFEKALPARQSVPSAGFQNMRKKRIRPLGAGDTARRRNLLRRRLTR